MILIRTVATYLLVGTAYFCACASAIPIDSQPQQLSRSSSRDCGTHRLFKRPFRVHIEGKPLTCQEAHRIFTRPCAIRLNSYWSCFSFRQPEPFLIWFPTNEIYEPWSTAIVFRRYPCSKAWISPAEFKPNNRDIFPTKRQLLADDLLRCQMLRKLSLNQVERLIGPPDEREDSQKRVTLIYWLGPERDSFTQIDPEGLLIELVDDHVSAALMFQG